MAFLDVLGVEATKSKALEFLAALIELDLADLMAIGDNWNDLEMLERAGLGVIMGNADPVLKKRGFGDGHERGVRGGGSDRKVPAVSFDGARKDWSRPSPRAHSGGSFSTLSLLQTRITRTRRCSRR